MDAFASDTVVFNDLGSGENVYSTSSGWKISGTNGPGGLTEAAFSFFPSRTTEFAELDIALSYPSIFGDPNSVIVNLMSDSQGTPGTVLQSWNVENLPLITSCCVLATLSGNGTITLVAGLPYWVDVQPTSPQSYMVWDWNTVGVSTNPCCATPPGTLLINDGSGWAHQSQFAYPAPAFEVLAEATPEPGTSSLLATALFAVPFAVRRTKSERGKKRRFWRW
jgi:hypothetical protein